MFYIRGNEEKSSMLASLSRIIQPKALIVIEKTLTMSLSPKVTLKNVKMTKVLIISLFDNSFSTLLVIKHVLT